MLEGDDRGRGHGVLAQALNAKGEAMQGAMIIKDRIGEWPVYPGHPLVLATEIMEVFPSFAAANEPTAQGWSSALGDQRITGAGCHVGAAMRVLKIGLEGGRREDMISYANRYWEDGKAGGHVKNVEAGRMQSQAIEAKFLELCQSWFSPVVGSGARSHE